MSGQCPVLLPWIPLIAPRGTPSTPSESPDVVRCGRSSARRCEMPSKVDQIHTIGLMAAHEAGIADLYRAYAERLPEHREFLEGLADDEVGHARQIAGLAEWVKAGLVHVNPGRFNEQSILSSLDFVRERVQEVKKAGVSPLAAFATGADIENAMIEKKFFEIFESDEAALEQLLRALAAVTSLHRRKLMEALEKERGRGGR